MFGWAEQTSQGTETGLSDQVVKPERGQRSQTPQVSASHSFRLLYGLPFLET